MDSDMDPGPAPRTCVKSHVRIARVAKNKTWRAEIHERELAKMSSSELAGHVSNSRQLWASWLTDMDPETGSVTSNSSTSAPSRSTDSSAQMEADRTELEAAEALTELGNLAMRERVAESAAKWGRKGKRVRKRVKSESSPSDSLLNPVDSAPPCPDLVEDRAVQAQQQVQAISRNMEIKPVKAEQDAESLKAGSSCAPRNPSTGGGRLKQNLSEAEKEERRIRRILANRESARQTIRRRQALCEELSRKAADLAFENANLKRERELALKEYQSLETINKHLKEQVSKAIKPEVAQAAVVPKSSHVEISASPSTTCPMFLYNHHTFQPLCWPPILQTSHHMHSQHGSHNAFIIPSTIPLPDPDKLLSSQEEENPINDDGPRTPVYIMPCPWFFSLPDRGNGLCPRPSFGVKSIQDEVFANNHYSAISSLNTATDIQHHTPDLPIVVKEEASGSTESRTTNELNRASVGFPPDGGGYHIGLHPKESMLASAPHSSAGPTFFFKQENVFQSDYSYNHEVLSTKVGHASGALPKKSQRVLDYPKKSADTVAAAEARKRRKELTKMKNINGRQCRMHA